MSKLSVCAAVICGICLGAYAQQAQVIKHVIAYSDPERYAGWPANGGIWSWDDEIVVHFTLAYLRTDGGGSYPIDRERGRVLRQLRSTDGGETWTPEKPSFLTEDDQLKEAVPFEGPIDFMQPNFAMKFQMQSSTKGVSTFFWSNDRCETWHGPFNLPMFGRTGILARTDYIVDGPHEMMAFLASTKDEGGEGWPFCARTTDGAVTWEFVSWIGEQPEGTGYSIMPATVRLSDSELYTYIRNRRGEKPNETFFMHPFRSLDNGKTWTVEAENRIDGVGNPPSMIQLDDGRLALTYGVRTPPYSIRAKLSSDGGKTWTPEIILRDDGAAWDLGYARTVQRIDGKIVTVYYFNDATRPERYIGATIWDPGTK